MKLALATILIVTLAPAIVAQSPSFQGLGDFPAGPSNSQASSVSADGVVVGGTGTNASGNVGFVWRASANPPMTSIGDLFGAAYYSSVTALSSDGSVAVGVSSGSTGYQAVRFDQGGLTGIGDLAGGSFSSIAYACSASGTVIVGSGQSAKGTEAFRWTVETGMVGLGDLPGGGFSSVATGVTADGLRVVGYSQTSAGIEAFRWIQGSGMEALGDLAGGVIECYPNAISGDGTTIVGIGTGPNGYEAFRWTSGQGFVGLGDFPGGATQSGATATSFDGSVVVGNGRTTLGSEAFYWTPSLGFRGLRQILAEDYGLNLSGWVLRDATGVSADGKTVCGWGTDPNGSPQAFVAYLPGRAVKGLVSIPELLGDVAHVPCRIEYRNPTTHSVVSARDFRPSSDGSFAFRAPVGGVYDVYVRSHHSLWACARSIDFSGDLVSGLRFDLTLGDIDGDNSVTVYDYNLLTTAFDTVPGDAKWDARCDLDGDGFVSVFDYSILSNHFDEEGSR